MWDRTEIKDKHLFTLYLHNWYGGTGVRIAPALRSGTSSFRLAVAIFNRFDSAKPWGSGNQVRGPFKLANRHLISTPNQFSSTDCFIIEFIIIFVMSYQERLKSAQTPVSHRFTSGTKPPWNFLCLSYSIFHPSFIKTIFFFFVLIKIKWLSFLNGSSYLRLK